MIDLTFSGTDDGLRVLCLGAHSDDIEIGCGATMLSLLSARSDVEVSWVVFSARGSRGEEARRGADQFLQNAAGQEVQLHEFRDGFFPYDGAAIKERFEDLAGHCNPDLILTHRGRDRHQDHRLVSELTWNTFRNHLILEYEIPKYDGDLESPNVFVEVSDETRVRKLDLLLDVFASQRSKRWFTAETFNGLMRLRGVEGAVSSGFAEGFHARKVVLGCHE